MFFGPDYERGFFIICCFAGVGIVATGVGLMWLVVWVSNHIAISVV